MAGYDRAEAGTGTGLETRRVVSHPCPESSVPFCVPSALSSGAKIPREHARADSLKR